MRTRIVPSLLRTIGASAIATTLLLLALPSTSHSQSSGESAEPLRIAVFGASGRVGSRIVAEALSRGHYVTGVSRDPSTMALEHPRFTKAAGDVTDADSVAGLIAGNDAVVSAIGGSNPDSDDPADSIPAQAGRALIAAFRRVGADAPRLLIVGGGSTTLESSPGVPIDDPTDIPTGARGARILGHRVVLDELKTIDDIRWTFLSPALEMRPGERTGRFRVGGSVVIRDADGESRISMEDFAVAILDEIERPQHIGEQMTVAY